MALTGDRVAVRMCAVSIGKSLSKARCDRRLRTAKAIRTAGSNAEPRESGGNFCCLID